MGDIHFSLKNFLQLFFSALRIGCGVFVQT